MNDVSVPQLIKLHDEIRTGRVHGENLQTFLENPDRYDQSLGRFGRIWPVTIDGNIGVDKLIQRGNYGWKNDDATQKNFCYLRKGQTTIGLELYEFDDTVTGSEAAEKIEADGYQLEESDALLNFGIKYPIEQRRRPIVCLGKNSRWRDRGGSVCVLCLGGVVSDRDLNVYNLGNQFNPLYRFLVSRKPACPAGR